MGTAAIAGTPTYAVASTGTTLAVPVPAGTAVGDLLVAVLVDQLSSMTGPFTASGWTRQGPAFVASSSAHRVLDTLTYPVTGTVPSGSVTFTLPATGGRKVGIMFRVTGADLSNPVLAAGAWSADSTSQSSQAFTGVTAGATALALFVAEANFSSPNAHSVSSVSPGTLGGATGQLGYWTSPDAASTSVSRTWLGAWAARAASPIPTQTVTWGGASANRSGYVIAFRDAPAGASITPTPGMTMWNGTAEVPVQLSNYDGTTEKLVTSWAHAPGDTPISDVLQRARFYVAHRGGSKCWPEMTAAAYRRSALIYGVPALEMSVHRTSDGVFVLSHDANLLRVTGTSIDIATSTWSQLSGLTVKASTTDNGTQPDEPLARLVDVLPLWADKRTIFIEDKTYNATNRADLIAYLKTFAGWADRFVWKVAGAATDPAALAGKVAGMKSWGYFFTGTDMDATAFPARAARFDYIGVDYQFTAGEWALAEASGVPMIAHIIATQQQLDTVNQHAIRGVMLAQVRDLYPR